MFHPGQVVILLPTVAMTFYSRLSLSCDFIELLGCVLCHPSRDAKVNRDNNPDSVEATAADSRALTDLGQYLIAIISTVRRVY